MVDAAALKSASDALDMEWDEVETAAKERIARHRCERSSGVHACVCVVCVRVCVYVCVCSRVWFEAQIPFD
jgi:hypothetical protein